MTKRTFMRGDRRPTLSAVLGEASCNDPGFSSEDAFRRATEGRSCESEHEPRGRHDERRESDRVDRAVTKPDDHEPQAEAVKDLGRCVVFPLREIAVESSSADTAHGKPDRDADQSKVPVEVEQ